MTMTFEQVHVAVTQAGTWVGYGGTARIVLAGVLVAAAGCAAYAGTRLPLPARAPRPGQKTANFMLAAWIFAMTAFLVCVGGRRSAGTPGSSASRPATGSHHARYPDRRRSHLRHHRSHQQLP